MRDGGSIPVKKIKNTWGSDGWNVFLGFRCLYMRARVRKDCGRVSGGSEGMYDVVDQKSKMHTKSNRKLYIGNERTYGSGDAGSWG